MTDVESVPHLRQTVLDTTDCRALGNFYRELLGYEFRPGDEPPAPGQRDKDWLVLWDGNGVPKLAFQQVDQLTHTTWPEPTVPQQYHLDMTVPSVEELHVQHERVLRLGGTLRYDRSHTGHEPLRVYADPDGHLFCIFVAR